MTAKYKAAVLALVLLVAACGGGDKSAKKPKSTTSTGAGATTAPAGTPSGIAPLTGLPGDPGKLSRPALLVKIDNAPKALPQAGLNQADVVVEEGVEGGITRFAAIFHSADADPLGPVRSARTTDIIFASALNHPLFGYSGANAEFENRLNSAPVVNVGPYKFPAGYHRQSGRPAPYNLFTTTATLYSRTPAGATAPPALFTYGSPSGGAPAGGVHVEYRGHVTTAVDWNWDAGAHAWKRSENGAPHVDAAGQQMHAPNLIVEFVTYKDTGFTDQSGTPVPEAQLIGEGEAWVLVNGQVFKGRWQKASAEAVTTYTGADGKPLVLSPGRTWIELPASGLAQLR